MLINKKNDKDEQSKSDPQEITEAPAELSLSLVRRLIHVRTIGIKALQRHDLSHLSNVL